MATVRSVFLNEKQARAALERLRMAFPDGSIEMQRIVSPKRRGVDPGEYDPAGSAFLAGTAVATMAATGSNMIGNSTTMAVSIGDLDEILAMAAKDDEDPAHRRSARIVASVQVQTDSDAAMAASLLEAAGGRLLDEQPDWQDTSENTSSDTEPHDTD